MTEVYSAYEEEYQQIKESITSKLLKDCKEQRGEQKKATLRRIEMELDEADEIIAQMEMEAKGKAKLAIKTRSYKSEVKGWRSQVQTHLSTSDRDVLLSMPSQPSSYAMDYDDEEAYTSSSTAAQRSRLLNSQQTLKSTDARLDNSLGMAHESEAIGTSILDRLRGQGEQLRNAGNVLGEADGSIQKASGTLNKMIRGMYKQKFLLWGLIAVFVALIGLTLWLKFR